MIFQKNETFFHFLDALLLDLPDHTLVIDEWIFEWIVKPIEGLERYRQWILGLIVKESVVFYGQFFHRMHCHFYQTGQHLPWKTRSSRAIGTTQIVRIFLKSLKIALLDDIQVAMAHIQTWTHTHMALWEAASYEEKF